VATYPSLQSSPPKSSDITINVFVFSSLTLALTCAFVGILRKEQLKQHLSWIGKRKDARAQLEDRQFSFEMNDHRTLWDSANQLSIGLTLSIALFAVGIFVLLWNLHWFVALAVFLFLCSTLCLIFWRDVPYYCLRLRASTRAVRVKVFGALPDTWERLVRLFDFDEELVEEGLRPSENEDDMVCTLSRAIMFRTSGLTAPDIVDPDFWQHRVRGLLGLARLSRPSGRAEARTVMLRRIMDVVVTVVKDRVHPKKSVGGPLTLWAWINGRLTPERTSLRQLELPTGWHKTRDAVAMVEQWQTRLVCAFGNRFKTEEICLLSDVVSEQLSRTLRTTKSLPRDATGVEGSLEELLSAFYLAQTMHRAVPDGHSGSKIKQAIALAGVQLLANRSSDSGLAIDEHDRGDDAGCLPPSANPELLGDVDSTIRAFCVDLRTIFLDEFKDLWKIKDGENLSGAL
jgi:hypothetical protein